MDGNNNGAHRGSPAATHNPWRAFVSHLTYEGYTDPPTNDSALQDARSAWRRIFGEQQVTLGVKDPIPLEQGSILGSGGVGAVYETKLDGTVVAWKRTYTRRLTDWHLNEVKILGQMAEDRHKHIIKFIGSYIHRQRNSTYELAIITWPVARCDLSVLLHEVDIINNWKGRDEPWDEHDRSAPATEEEKAAYDNLLRLEQLDHLRPQIFTWELRERLLMAVKKRLRRSIGCIAEAVAYLHDHNIRHKDIKPSQILLSSKGLWLTDFGWSKDTSQLSSSETSGGDRITIRYHAPERAQMGKCGRPEDIFALGCTYLEMAYRIYDLKADSYLNPHGHSMWSFQANLNALNTWLAPFMAGFNQGNSGNYKGASDLARLIWFMMKSEPQLRPDIFDILKELHRMQGWNFLFEICCSEPPASSYHATDGSAESEAAELSADVSNPGGDNGVEAPLEAEGWLLRVDDDRSANEKKAEHDDGDISKWRNFGSIFKDEEGTDRCPICTHLVKDLYCSTCHTFFLESGEVDAGKTVDQDWMKNEDQDYPHPEAHSESSIMQSGEEGTVNEGRASRSEHATTNDNTRDYDDSSNEQTAFHLRSPRRQRREYDPGIKAMFAAHKRSLEASRELLLPF